MRTHVMYSLRLDFKVNNLLKLDTRMENKNVGNNLNFPALLIISKIFFFYVTHAYDYANSTIQLKHTMS